MFDRFIQRPLGHTDALGSSNDPVDVEELHGLIKTLPFFGSDEVLPWDPNITKI